MGAYTRANAEVCLLGISKDTKAKEIVKSHAVHQVIQEPIMRHSQKPKETIKRIETLIGGGSENRIVCKGRSQQLGLLG